MFLAKKPAFSSIKVSLGISLLIKKKAEQEAHAFYLVSALEKTRKKLGKKEGKEIAILDGSDEIPLSSSAHRCMRQVTKESKNRDIQVGIVEIPKSCRIIYQMKNIKQNLQRKMKGKQRNENNGKSFCLLMSLTKQRYCD